MDFESWDWATILTWIVRSLLPIILFCLWFKPHRAKEEDEGGEALLGERQDEYGRQPQREPSGPNCYSRRRMLAHRQAVDGDPVPESLATVVMQVRTTQAPRPARAPRKEGKTERSSAANAEAPRRSKPRPVAPAESSFVAAPTPASVEAMEMRETEVKMHLACLVNYVAFNHKEPQRHFLMEEGVPPPPPPRPKKSAAAGQSAKVPEDVAAKTNKEAQMILQGALRFKASTVAKALHQDLSEQQVEISESTFTLMIETAVAAADLKSASDLLMKMETAGGCPDTDLLDKVMDLYSQQKSKREQQRQAALASSNSEQQPIDGIHASQVAAPLIPNEDFIRAKLSSKAPAFVPTFSTVPTPPPAPAHPLAPAAGAAASDAAPAGDASAGAAAGSDDRLAEAEPSANVPAQAPAEEPQPILATEAASPSEETVKNDGGSAEAPAEAEAEAEAEAAAGANLISPPAATPAPAPAQRTKLVSSAKPFEPQLATTGFNVGFDPYTGYGWPADHPMALGGYGPIYAEGMQGAGWGQGGGRWTSPEADQQQAVQQQADTWVTA